MLTAFPFHPMAIQITSTHPDQRRKGKRKEKENWLLNSLGMNRLSYNLPYGVRTIDSPYSEVSYAIFFLVSIVEIRMAHVYGVKDKV